jgi:hypothetical protein
VVGALILSRERPAQLELLLTSLERNAPGVFDWRVLWRDDIDPDGYEWELQRQHGIGRFARELRPGDFELFVRGILDECEHEHFAFFCDDDVLYRPLPRVVWPGGNTQIICVSLRLGENTVVQYPTGRSQRFPGHLPWEWLEAEGDFGYPGSVDGHVFRTHDLRGLLAGRMFPNPTALECALADACLAAESERPLMACFPRSLLVGVPVNRVSEQSNVRHGGSMIYSAESLRASWEQGMRLDLDAIDFTGVDGAHTELDLRWRLPAGKIAV